jgi:hypothetical protein
MVTFNRSANPPMILPVSPGDGIVHRRFAGQARLTAPPVIALLLKLRSPSRQEPEPCCTAK